MSSDIAKLDTNFLANDKKFPDMKLIDCREEPICLYGLCKDEQVFTRLPLYFLESDEVSEPLKHFLKNTAGVRMRFKTNSPYIALYAVLDKCRYEFHHMADTGAFGFDMYAKDEGFCREDEFVKTFLPVLKEDMSFSDCWEFEDSKMREITINFPLYGDVKNVFIGIKDTAVIEAPRPYSIDKPVVVYGSSITQGGCASRPGNCYTNILSRRLDCDVVNLGFSGSGRGEKAVADYIATIDMSAFVLDYDYNCMGVDKLENTHHVFYKTIRDAHPDIPIVMMTAPKPIPKLYPFDEVFTLRRIVIMKSYIKGIEAGDKNLYFVDGTSLLGTDRNCDSTVDGTHPNDYGFRQMADRLYPVLNTVLK